MPRIDRFGGVTVAGTEIHLEMDAPTSLHGNGAASFALTTRDPAEVSCRLCLYLWHRNPIADRADRQAYEPPTT